MPDETRDRTHRDHAERTPPRDEEPLPNYEDTTDPRYPPGVILSARTRRRVFWAYMGPVVAFFLAVGIVFVYWANRAPRRLSPVGDGQTIGTSGQTDRPGHYTYGGSDPRSPYSSTRDELSTRGDTEPAIGQ